MQTWRRFVRLLWWLRCCVSSTSSREDFPALRSYCKHHEWHERCGIIVSTTNKHTLNKRIVVGHDVWGSKKPSQISLPPFSYTNDPMGSYTARDQLVLTASTPKRNMAAGKRQWSNTIKA
uniref:Putative secreted protein n=1 Tax=Ixodes ricinus TaxID=34613 RepID=A0A6B0UNB9_IXORI